MAIGPAIHRLLQCPTRRSAGWDILRRTDRLGPPATSTAQGRARLGKQGNREPETIWTIVAPKKTERLIRPPSQRSVECSTRPRDGGSAKKEGGALPFYRQATLIGNRGAATAWGFQTFAAGLSCPGSRCRAF